MSAGGPYVPYQIATTASPKQKIKARTFYKLEESFSSSREVIRKSPTAPKIWISHPAEITGEIPSSMRVPLLEAMMTLAQ